MTSPIEVTQQRSSMVVRLVMTREEIKRSMPQVFSLPGVDTKRVVLVIEEARNE